MTEDTITVQEMAAFIREKMIAGPNLDFWFECWDTFQLDTVVRWTANSFKIEKYFPDTAQQDELKSVIRTLHLEIAQERFSDGAPLTIIVLDGLVECGCITREEARSYKNITGEKWARFPKKPIRFRQKAALNDALKALQPEPGGKLYAEDLAWAAREVDTFLASLGVKPQDRSGVWIQVQAGLGNGQGDVSKARLINNNEGQWEFLSLLRTPYGDPERRWRLESIPHCLECVLKDWRGGKK